MAFRGLRPGRARRGTPAAPGGGEKLQKSRHALCVPGYGVPGYGAAGAPRTHDPPLIRQWLCQLSYDGTKKSAEPLFDALDDIILPYFFGSKVQFSNQAETFCSLSNEIAVPLFCSPLGYAEPQRRAKNCM